MKLIAAPLLAAVVTWTTLIPNVTAQNEDLYCAGVNEKAIECGATVSQIC